MAIKSHLHLLRDVRPNPQIMGLLVVAALLWAFARITNAVVGGETRAFDTSLLIALRNPADLTDPLGPIWIEELGRDLSALGGTFVLSFLTLSIAGFFWLQRQRITSAFLLLAVTTGVGLSQLLKAGFDRPRPDLVSQETAIYTASFPSGHSMMATVVYLTLAVLAARTLKRRREKGYVVSLAILIVLGVGISRVYLGVHWPTDVLAGWIIGAGWALICGLFARFLDRAGPQDRSSRPGPDT
ncbi:phosphatase PAP2 family protein [Dinoroseobacter sp. PD6]|uniref:phosphatase PAP2 family protein n=1 Tax=Dinoroseobacter sp. PD6 TaxID=3028384 RepID=UPI00237A1781|nr:phosphatase PAP2 family protein [Dinoroseobacter sp. PD6]